MKNYLAPALIGAAALGYAAKADASIIYNMVETGVTTDNLVTMTITNNSTTNFPQESLAQFTVPFADYVANSATISRDGWDVSYDLPNSSLVFTSLDSSVNLPTNDNLQWQASTTSNLRALQPVLFESQGAGNVSNNYNLPSVPEPASLATLLLGSAALLYRRRK